MLAARAASDNVQKKDQAKKPKGANLMASLGVYVPCSEIGSRSGIAGGCRLDPLSADYFHKQNNSEDQPMRCLHGRL
ncbi:hypothetical protein DN730_08300 [Marinomonas piezotolerans]|uniref:Uncharacterized protein n=1 Tax=Marinomonas piezotolerans TaxID=2213058 RepID=A0A370U9E6_9GAMM|nr:hypothetical protein DN730_08300 [Marinomonas piezotolerans]